MGAQVNVHEAKTHFSKLLGRVALGEKIVIAKAGEPVAMLTPIAPKRARVPGGAEGLAVPASFFDELPEGFIEQFR